MSCSRADCKAYNCKFANNCVALTDIYNNDSECKFFKTKEEYNAEIEALKERPEYRLLIKKYGKRRASNV